MDIAERVYRNVEKHAVKICFVLAVILASIITSGIYSRVDAAAQEKLQEHLAQEVLRFHVLANSDSDKDQELKLQVRDAVLGYMEENVPEEDSADAVKDWARAHIDEIEDVSRGVIAEDGADYPVSAAVTTCWFPDKSYGDVTFPAGNNHTHNQWFRRNRDKPQG